MSGGRSDVLRLLPPPDVAVTTYEQRYGLGERPFGSSPDVRFACLAESFGVALDGTSRAIGRREGLVTVTGGAGSGKTLLCRLLVQQLDPSIPVSVVLDPYLSFEELLLQVLCDFGAVPAGTIAAARPSRHQLLAVLQRFLASLMAQDASALIVIDDSHHLGPAVLQQLRVLLNLETDEGKLLQIVLVGETTLDALLGRPELSTVSERVARRYTILPLSPLETKRYVEKRLAVAAEMGESGSAGAAMVTFAPVAVRAVWSATAGNPRAINRLCDRVLDVAHAEGSFTITRRLVRQAGSRVGAESAAGRSRTRMAAMAAAAVLVIAVPGGWFLAAREPRLIRAASEPVMAIDPALSGTGPALQSGRAAPHAVGRVLSRAGSPPSMRPLPVMSAASVAAASFEGAAQATAVAGRLQGLGLPAFARPAGGLYQVVVGPYASRLEAEEVQRTLASHGMSQTRVLVNDAPSALAGASAGAGGALELAGAALLLVPGRTSVVFDMPDEPRQVVVRRAGNSVLEVDAGPVRRGVGPSLLTSPPGVGAVDAISIDAHEPPGMDPFVRARLTVPSATNGHVRVLGRRIYLDLVQPVAPGERTPPSTPPAAVVVAQADTGSSLDAYRLAIDAALHRFEEIEPFLMSAVAAPETNVLSALANTLRALGTSVRLPSVPEEAKRAHEMLSSAVEQAERAVEPDFAGDRLAEARQAVSQFAAAKTRLRDVL